jgi:hypothetical protein
MDLAYKLKIKFQRSNIDLSAKLVLQPDVIRIYGIPCYAREEGIIQEITALVVETIKGDIFNFIKDEPVWVRVNCKNPANLSGFVEFSFNEVGHEIRFVAKKL